MTSSTLIHDALDARTTGSRIDFGILVPADLRPDERLPLILHLHGAMSSAASLDAAKQAYDEAWDRGDLPRTLVACPTTPTLGGFYMDYPAGPTWERLVSDEFPALVEERFGTNGRRAMIGFSMGGYGALKIAFRNPEKYRAVAALCPVVFPGETPDAVPERNTPSVLGELHKAMGEDRATYAHNSVYGVLRANLDQLRRASPGVFIDCGEADEFGLHDGAEFLHKLLSDFGIRHVYRSIPGAGHADAMIGERQCEAFRFIGARLSSL